MELRSIEMELAGAVPGGGPSRNVISRLLLRACEEAVEWLVGLRFVRWRSKGTGASLVARAREGMTRLVVDVDVNCSLEALRPMAARLALA